jgi:hypothetical protein
MTSGRAVPPQKIVSRDPFYLEQVPSIKKDHNKIKKIPHQNKQILLEGIMAMGNHLAAVVNDGTDSEVVVVGDCIWGYMVKCIDNDKIVLVCGKNVKTLALD